MQQSPIDTYSAEYDLRAWLMASDRYLGGRQRDRTTEFLQQNSFSEVHLQRAIKYAIEEIRDELEHKDSLIAYGNRPPYCLDFDYDDDTVEGHIADFDRKVKFGGGRRKVLQQYLLRAAKDLDYLRHSFGQVTKTILHAKRSLAKEGDCWEIEHLLKLGVVTKEWVLEECVIE